MLVRQFINKARELIKENEIRSLDDFSLLVYEEGYNDDALLIEHAQEVEWNYFYTSAVDVYALEDGIVGVKGVWHLNQEAKFGHQYSTSGAPLVQVNVYEPIPYTKYRRKIVN